MRACRASVKAASDRNNPARRFLQTESPPRAGILLSFDGTPAAPRCNRADDGLAHAEGLGDPPLRLAGGELAADRADLVWVQAGLAVAATKLGDRKHGGRMQAHAAIVAPAPRARGEYP